MFNESFAFVSSCVPISTYIFHLALWTTWDEYTYDNERNKTLFLCFNRQNKSIIRNDLWSPNAKLSSYEYFYDQWLYSQSGIKQDFISTSTLFFFFTYFICWNFSESDFRSFFAIMNRLKGNHTGLIIQITDLSRLNRFHKHWHTH